MSLALESVLHFHSYLINLMVFHCFICIQELFQVSENLQKALGRNPTEDELAEATNMSTVQVRRHLEVGQAARSKLIKVSRTLFSTPFMQHVKYMFSGFCIFQDTLVAIDAPLFNGVIVAQTCFANRTCYWLPLSQQCCLRPSPFQFLIPVSGFLILFDYKG